MTGLSPLIYDIDLGKDLVRFLTDAPKSGRTPFGNFVPTGRIARVCSRRMFADKCDPEFAHRATLSSRIEHPNVCHQRPDSILILSVIETTKLTRHGQRQ